MTEYPIAFWTHAFTKVLGWGADILVVYLLILRFENILIWTANEVLFFYTLNITSYSLAGFFMYHPFERLSEHIQNGSFDEILTKPLSPFLYLCFKEFSTGYAGNMIISLMALIYCINELKITVNIFNIILLIIIIVSGMLIHSSLLILFNIPAFWIIRTDALRLMKDSFLEFIKYPISIYDRWIQVILTIFIPLAFVSFLPAQILLNKFDSLCFDHRIIYIAPFIGITLLGLSIVLFNIGIRHYKSTGS